MSETLSSIFERIKAIQDTTDYQLHSRRLAEEHAAYELAQRKHAHAERLRSTGVPVEVTTLAPEETDASRAVTEFLAGPESLRFLVLSGARGRGKTYAAAVAVWRNGGRYVDAHDLVATGTYGDDAQDWADLARVKLLVIDELGAEHSNAAYEANLYALLDRRYRANRRTIAITNLNAPAFRERYAAAGLDRLLDRLRTGGRWVALEGPSLRRHWSEPDTQEANP